MTAVTRRVYDIEATSDELPAMRALEIAPEVAVIFAPVFGRVLDAMSTENGLGQLGPAIGQAASDLLGGKLAQLALPLLATTYVVVGTGKNRERIDLTSHDAINRAFAGHLDAMLGVLLLAAEVTFGKVFGVTATLRRRAMAVSESKDSIPSTSAAGQRGG